MDTVRTDVSGSPGDLGIYIVHHQRPTSFCGPDHVLEPAIEPPPTGLELLGESHKMACTTLKRASRRKVENVAREEVRMNATLGRGATVGIWR